MSCPFELSMKKVVKARDLDKILHGILDISCAKPGNYYHFSNHSALNAL